MHCRVNALHAVADTKDEKSATLSPPPDATPSDAANTAHTLLHALQETSHQRSMVARVRLQHHSQSQQYLIRCRNGRAPLEWPQSSLRARQGTPTAAGSRRAKAVSRRGAGKRGRFRPRDAQHPLTDAGERGTHVEGMASGEHDLQPAGQRERVARRVRESPLQ